MEKTQITLMTCALLWIASCQGRNEESLKEPDSPQTDTINAAGIQPPSIDEVADVFEVKYGETKEWRYKDKAYRFSIKDIEDHLLNCAAVDCLNGGSECLEQLFLIATVYMETDKKSFILQIKTNPCFWNFYKNDGTDIQNVWDLLASWPSGTDVDPFFKWKFPQNFGKGTLLPDSSLSIFIAKVYPHKYGPELNYNVSNSMYKFIFIIADTENQPNENN